MNKVAIGEKSVYKTFLDRVHRIGKLLETDKPLAKDLMFKTIEQTRNIPHEKLNLNSQHLFGDFLQTVREMHPAEFKKRYE